MTWLPSMMMPTPQALISRTCYLRWEPPRHELLDRRGAVITALNRHDDLHGFQAAGGEVEVRLGGNRAVTATPTGVLAFALVGAHSPAAPDVEDALVVAETLGVDQAVVRFEFQHLVAWPGEIAVAAACDQAAKRISPSAEVNLTDFALLADGTGADGWLYQVEFGVIAATDAPLRIGRHIGRSAGHRQPFDQELFDLQYPAVATFVDSSWRRPTVITELKKLRDLAHTVCEDAGTLAQTLHRSSQNPATDEDHPRPLTRKETLIP